MLVAKLPGQGNNPLPPEIWGVFQDVAGQLLDLDIEIELDPGLENGRLESPEAIQVVNFFLPKLSPLGISHANLAKALVHVTEARVFDASLRFGTSAAACAQAFLATCDHCGCGFISVRD